MTAETCTPAGSEVLTWMDHADAVGDRLQRPVRKNLSEALEAYWQAAHAEGREGRTHDTEDGAAQRALDDVLAAAAQQVAAERERCADIVRNAAAHHGLCCSDCDGLADLISGLGATHRA